MSEIDQQFIEYVVKSLVGKPDAVHIDRRIDEKGVLLELTVDPEDLGRVIGQRGATAQSLRTLLRALGTQNDARYNLKIVDNGVDRPERAPASDQPKADDSAASDDGAQDSTADKDVPDQPAQADSPPESPKEQEPEPEPVPEAKAEKATESETSDRLAQTRQELADLDDLDL